MASSNQATSQKQSTAAAQIANMHQSMRSAMNTNDLIKLRDTLRTRVLDKNSGNTKLTDEERNAEIYKDILLYVCARYHTYSDGSQASYEARHVYPVENGNIISILSVLMQHIFPLSEEQNSGLLLEALEKSVEKLEGKRTLNNQISTELMPSILERCSAETLFHIFINATPKLFANLPKKPELLRRLPSGKQQSLLQTAIEEKKLELAHLLIMLPNSRLFQSLESDELKIQLLKQAIAAKNLPLVKDLLGQDGDLIDSLEPGSQLRLIRTAIDCKDIELIRGLLKNHPNLFLVPLHNFKLPLLHAAEKNLWPIVDAIYEGSQFIPSPESYKVFLKALNANTEESREFAVKFAQQNQRFICAFYFSDEKGNTALHYAMKNGLKEVVQIILNKENYSLEGASIEEFVQQEKLGEQKNKSFTAIDLAAIQGKWDMVALHADLYKVETWEWSKLYSEIVVAAIQAGTPAALRAVLSLLSSKKIQFSFTTSWIMQRIQDLIFDKKTNDQDINAVFYALLESVASKGRFELLSQLAVEVEVSFSNVFTRKKSSKSDDIKNNIVALIQQISHPILRTDIILSFLINKPSPVWTEKGDKLHNGTREKLIAILNTDLKEILKLEAGISEVKAIFDRVKALLDAHAHSKESILTVEGFFKFVPHAVMRLRLLKDFMGVVLGENPVFSFAEFQALPPKEQEVIQAEILALYEESIAENKAIHAIFCGNLPLFPESAISHILQEHRPAVKNFLSSTALTSMPDSSLESGEIKIGSEFSPQPSAPPHSSLFNGGAIGMAEEFSCAKQLDGSDSASDDDNNAPTAGADALMVDVSEGYQEQGTSDGRTRVRVPRTPASSHPTPSAPPLTLPSESIPPAVSSSSSSASSPRFFPSVPTTPVAVSNSLAMFPSVPTTPPQNRQATPPDSSQRKEEKKQRVALNS